MTRILYIASQSHSGSTLLELLLSAHPRVCGLGETAMLIDPRSRPRYLRQLDHHRCSCGEPLEQCPLWSSFVEYLQKTPPESFAVGYKRLLAEARRVHGEDVIVADSSKYLGALEQLAGFLDEDVPRRPRLFVVHLIRDVRGFATSLKRRDRISGPRSVFRSWRRFTAWHRANLALERFLGDNSLPYVRVGYEELCADPRGALETICRGAGLDFTPGMLEPGNSSGHIGLGNPMRNQAAKRAGIFYDDRWQHESATGWVYSIRRAVRRYNEAAVYRNLPVAGS